MGKKYVIYFCILTAALFTIQNCKTDPKKISGNGNTGTGNGLNESFRKTGWITETKYRAVIFVITVEECKTSSLAEIEERIKLEAYKNLQKELSPSFNRNAFNQIKNLADNYGKMNAADAACSEGNIYFYDIEKPDLKSEFVKIKNIK